MKLIHPATIGKASGSAKSAVNSALIDPNLIITVGSRIDISVDFLRSIVSTLLDEEAFDEDFYIATYPDVAKALQAGTYEKGFTHFKEIGFWEGRLPHSFDVDEDWYKKTYPDIKLAMDRRIFRSASDHFVSHGYREGRRPNADVEWLG